MKSRTLLVLILCLCTQAIAQSGKDKVNTLSIKGETIKEGATVELVCASEECWTKSDKPSYTSFKLSGKFNDRNVLISVEVPVTKGSFKVRTDKDGDLQDHESLTVEIFGSNPAVDKESYEVQDEADEGVVSILHNDEKMLEGTISVKYFDSATAVKRLSASCHFLLRKN
ncbi:MAG: hypothetical protein IPP51_05680 [Bacteroidetes bacterium]|nr:hypothetical protein [Bacteroidota bacterium]